MRQFAFSHFHEVPAHVSLIKSVVPRILATASALYAGRIPVFVSPSQTDIENDISKQNLAGKPCHMAQIANGKISYKAHVFHRVGG